MAWRTKPRSNAVTFESASLMWNFDYLDPPRCGPDGSADGIRPYLRHGKGGNYSWVDNHVSITRWLRMATGANGKFNWFSMSTSMDPDF